MDTSNLFEDVLSVRKEIQAVQSAATPLEQRTLNMTRAMSIMTSLEPRGVIQERDRQLFAQTKEALTKDLRDSMVKAVASK